MHRNFLFTKLSSKTHPDECNVIDVLVVRIIVLVDDEFSGIVPFATALQINISCINSPQTGTLTGQIFCSVLIFQRKELIFSHPTTQ